MRLFVFVVFLSAQHSGSYSRLMHVFPNVESRLFLFLSAVSFASSFLNAPTDKTANLGERVSLPCTVQDDFCLHANVSWFFSDTRILLSPDNTQYYSGRVLYIASMSTSDEGTYYCKVETRYGTIRSPDARLKGKKGGKKIFFKYDFLFFYL